jgi:uncharacterized membrane-anchored protein YjiN (DUF445 family)
MNVILSSLIQGVIGFAIGAGTNELAIRWVFWAIFSKKKKEIAAAVQRVVSRELMTPEKIAARLASPQVNETLRTSILKALDETAAGKLPSLDALFGANPEAAQHLDGLQRHLAALAADVVSAHIAAPGFRDTALRALLSEQWQRLAPRHPGDLLPDCTRELVAALPASLAAAVLAPEHRDRLCAVVANGITSWMDDYPTPSSFLGPANSDELTRLIGSRTRLLGDELAGLLDSAPAQTALQDALRSAVRKRLDGQGVIGSLLSGLTGAALVEDQLAKFCATVPDSVREQFASEKEGARMRELVETAVHKLLERPWSDLLGATAPEALAKHVRSVLASDAVRDMARSGFESVGASVVGSLQTETLAEASRMVAGDGDVSPYLDWLARALHAALCSRDVRGQFERQTDEILRRLRTLPIGEPNRFLPEKAKPQLAALLTDQITAFAHANIADLVEKTRIWDIISDSIIVYDEKKMEEITRSVANRELLWVTLLGGVIGLVVGVTEGFILNLIDRFL